MTLNPAAPASQRNSPPLLPHPRQQKQWRRLQNETESLQTACKDNAFIKTYSSSSSTTTPEARAHRLQSGAERGGCLKSTNDCLFAIV